MANETGREGPANGTLTRRALLRGSVAAMAGVVLVGRASAQVTRTGLIPTPERWDDANLAGFMVYIGQEPSPESPVQPRECDFESWPPEETSRYNATLINRKAESAPQEETTLFIDAGVNVAAGQLFLVNSFQPCDSPYVGLELEQIGRSDVPGAEGGPGVNIEADERTSTPEPGSGALGPGFGALAALAGVLGLGGWLAKRRE